MKRKEVGKQGHSGGLLGNDDPDHQCRAEYAKQASPEWGM
jgi:hypothetical protein